LGAIQPERVYTYRDKPALRQTGFSIYYASINIGVFLALASLGTIAKFVTWNMAFVTAGVMQLIGLIPLTVYLVKHKETYRNLKSMQKDIHQKNHPLTSVEKSRLLVIGSFCIFRSFFGSPITKPFRRWRFLRMII
jgi:dipeptide/tripeptide permease